MIITISIMICIIVYSIMIIIIMTITMYSNNGWPAPAADSASWAKHATAWDTAMNRIAIIITVDRMAIIVAMHRIAMITTMNSDYYTRDVVVPLNTLAVLCVWNGCVTNSWIGAPRNPAPRNPAPRNPAPGNHLLVWIVEPSGCHCTNGRLTSRVFTED